VDTNFLDRSTTRKSYADLVRGGEDLSDFDCYACHDKKKPPPLRLDTGGNIIVAKEHPDIVMGHGEHGRNNNCFNCHNETNLVLLQPRDGRELKFEDSPKLCGSCHGPTYRDWEAGAHGRTSGYWDRSKGPIERKACVNCHNPHSPRFPSRKPAPGPHPLREIGATAGPQTGQE
jgi:formate-dependent nitrite reductase cytochrome c552 subunit